MRSADALMRCAVLAALAALAGCSTLGSGVQAILSSIVACVYLLLQNRGSNKPVAHILGLHTLTPNGIPQPSTKPDTNGAANGNAATSSRWISPLLKRLMHGVK